MMIDPPLDKLIAKVGCKYALVCLITKRARYLLDKKADIVGTAANKAVSFAAKELYQDQLRIIE